MKDPGNEVGNKHDSRNSFERSLSYVSGYKARAVEHVCKFPFICFSLEVV